MVEGSKEEFLAQLFFLTVLGSIALGIVFLVSWLAGW